MERRKTKTVKVGDVLIGGNNPVSVQSMLNAPADDVEKNYEQALKLKDAGCQIIRVAVPDMCAIKTVEKLETVGVPIVADIHFDYKLAIEAVNAGIDKIRINPGNIGSDEKVKAVADACRAHGVPIRIGVNSGSLEKEILNKYGHPTAEALCESALKHVQILNQFDFDDIVISIKSSNVRTMIDAYELLAQKCDYPFHIGVTEAGGGTGGLVKSAVGIGSLLMNGIGDTIRVSLTDDTVKEVEAGYQILKACGLYNHGVSIVSCPTCGRTKINLIKIAKQAEERLKKVDKPITVAIMGCVVNGPGEAREADIGIAGGDGVGLIFKKGEILKKVPEENLLDELMLEIEKM